VLGQSPDCHLARKNCNENASALKIFLFPGLFGGQEIIGACIFGAMCLLYNLLIKFATALKVLSLLVD
jgi:hypothetical protein